MYRLDEKNRNIGDMFSAIAPRYDFLNRLLSAGIDRGWRRLAVRALTPAAGGRFLDVATGTADIALEIFRQKGSGARVTGADLSAGMMRFGQRKASKAGLASRMSFVQAPCESLPFRDAAFDSAAISFGIRNVVDRERGLSEMCRVVRPGGRVVVLEFSLPENRFFAMLYNFYFTTLLPRIGGLFSKRSAYTYLPDSVLSFPAPDVFERMMRDAGCATVTRKPLTFGIATLYVGTRDTESRKDASR
ncbi:MAG TPA: bifunctional demethylmenaquinone methyltransferase/2-methoxy-6-polyprenyl-1,4-benzoquinol methylase UbiE [Candidatus Deferrimicrobiaceae bacterium]